MAEEDISPHTAEILMGSVAPSLPSRLRGYLRSEYDVNVADITSRPYDRESMAPLLAQFVLSEVRDNPSAHVSGKQLERKIHALSVDRESDPEHYARQKAKAKQNITRLVSYVPEMQTARELVQSFAEDEVQVVLNDVLIALGSLRHTIASRNAAMQTTESPHSQLNATAS